MSTTKLHAAVAARKSRKSQIDSQITEVASAARKVDQFNGMSRKFEPSHEDEPARPSEGKKVQRTGEDTLREYRKFYSELFDMEAQVEFANTSAKADVVVDGTPVLTGVPASLLLHLEKKFAEVSKLVDELPVLDPAEDWTQDPASALFRTEPQKTSSTKKVQKALVLHPPTVEHPAQTQLVTVDEVAGYWSTTKFSGALTATRKALLQERCAAMLSAIKRARAEANLIDAPERRVGEALLGYVFRS